MKNMKYTFLLIFTISINCTANSTPESAVDVEPPINVELNYYLENNEIYLYVLLSNLLDSELWIDESHLCKEDYMPSEFFDVVAYSDNEKLGNAGYKGMIVDRIVENDPQHFVKLKPKEQRECKVKLSSYYSLYSNFDEVEVIYSRRNLSYKNIQKEFDLVSNKIRFPLKGMALKTYEPDAK